MDRYIYIKSDESKSYFTDNQTYRFNIHLKLPLYLTGVWKVALVQFRAKEKAKSKATEAIYIYSELCKERIVYGEERPLLRRLGKNKKVEWNYIFDNPFYVTVKRGEVREFEIYIKDENDIHASVLTRPAYLTLHLKPYPFL